jgi:hypothetical protein
MKILANPYKYISPSSWKPGEKLPDIDEVEFISDKQAHLESSENPENKERASLVLSNPCPTLLKTNKCRLCKAGFIWDGFRHLNQSNTFAFGGAAANRKKLAEREKLKIKKG